MNRSHVVHKLAADLVAKSSFFVISVLAARQLTPGAFGLFALASTLGWITALASDAGMQVHVARSVARDPAGARLLFRRWAPVRAATAATAGLLMFAGLGVLGIGGNDADAVALLMLAYLASGVAEFMYFFLRGLGRTDIEARLLMGHRVSALVCATAALWLWPSLRNLAIALALTATATLVMATARAWHLGRGAAGDRSSDLARDDFHETAPARPIVWREWRKQVLPLGVASVLSALYFRIDILLLEAWQGSYAVGLYNAVFRIVEGLRLVPAAVLAVALPTLFRAHDANPVMRVAAAVTACGTLLAAVMWMLAPWLVPALYGADYAAAVPAYRILLASFPLMSLNYALTHQLIGWDRHHAYAWLCGAALGFNLVLNAVLIPRYSFGGAAWATLATEGLLTAACLGLLTTDRRLRRADVAAALSARATAGAPQ